MADVLTERLKHLVTKRDLEPKERALALAMALGRERARRGGQPLEDAAWGDRALDALQSALLVPGLRAYFGPSWNPWSRGAASPAPSPASDEKDGRTQKPAQ